MASLTPTLHQVLHIHASVLKIMYPKRDTNMITAIGRAAHLNNEYKHRILTKHLYLAGLSTDLASFNSFELPSSDPPEPSSSPDPSFTGASVTSFRTQGFSKCS